MRLVKTILVIILVVAVISSMQRILSLVGKADVVSETELELKRLKQEEAELLARKAEIEKIEYIEREARDKLGLAKPGETVVVLPPDDVLRRLAPQIGDEDYISPPKPIWRRWVEVFFK